MRPSARFCTSALCAAQQRLNLPQASVLEQQTPLVCLHHRDWAPIYRLAFLVIGVEDRTAADTARTGTRNLTIGKREKSEWHMPAGCTSRDLSRDIRACLGRHLHSILKGEQCWADCDLLAEKVKEFLRERCGNYRNSVRARGIPCPYRHLKPISSRWYASRAISLLGLLHNILALTPELAKSKVHPAASHFAIRRKSQIQKKRG
jgi:hypothetical protein